MHFGFSGNVLAIEEKLWYGHTRSWDCGVWPWQWGIMMSDGATKGQCNHEQPCSVSSHFCQAHYLQWAPSKGDINFLLFHHCNRRDVQAFFFWESIYVCAGVLTIIVDCFTSPCSEFYLPFVFNVKKITAHPNHQSLTLKAWCSIVYTILLLNNRITAKHQRERERKNTFQHFSYLIPDFGPWHIFLHI